MLKFITTFFTVFILFLVTYGFGQTHVSTVTLFQNTTATVITRAFGAASTTGNLIVVHLSYDNQARSTLTVTDTKGNDYTRINGPTNWDGTNYRSELWYAYNIIGGGTAITITARLSGAPTSFMQIYASEYSGIQSAADPLDQFRSGAGNTTLVSTGTRTLTYSNELLYAASIGASGLISAGAGFNTRSSANQNIIEDKNVASAGPNSATFTCAGGNWVVDMASFRSTTSVLPIVLAGFSANALSDHEVQLDWATASEKNNAFFTVERSSDCSNFEEIGRLPGAGTTSKRHNYSYTDAAAPGGQVYYRLRQTDLDGSFEYSPLCTVSLQPQLQKSISCYPNPAGDQITVKGAAGALCNMRLVNALGETVEARLISIDAAQSAATLGLETLTPGIYYITGAGASTLLVKN